MSPLVRLVRRTLRSKRTWLIVVIQIVTQSTGAVSPTVVFCDSTDFDAYRRVGFYASVPIALFLLMTFILPFIFKRKMRAPKWGINKWMLGLVIIHASAGVVSLVSTAAAILFSCSYPLLRSNKVMFLAVAVHMATGIVLTPTMDGHPGNVATVIICITMELWSLIRMGPQGFGAEALNVYAALSGFTMTRAFIMLFELTGVFKNRRYGQGMMLAGFFGVWLAKVGAMTLLLSIIAMVIVTNHREVMRRVGDLSKETKKLVKDKQVEQYMYRNTLRFHRFEIYRMLSAGIEIDKMLEKLIDQSGDGIITKADMISFFQEDSMAEEIRATWNPIPAHQLKTLNPGLYESLRSGLALVLAEGQGTSARWSDKYSLCNQIHVPDTWQELLGGMDCQGAKALESAVETQKFPAGHMFIEHGKSVERLFFVENAFLQIKGYQFPAKGFIFGYQAYSHRQHHDICDSVVSKDGTIIRSIKFDAIDQDQILSAEVQCLIEKLLIQRHSVGTHQKICSADMVKKVAFQFHLAAKKHNAS